MSRKRKDLNQYVDIVANIRIDHDAYVLIRNELDIAFESVGSSPTPVCVLVTGETRTGKSCAVLEFAESNPTVEEGTQTRRSIVRAITPETATVKSLLESLLKGLGDPYWSRGTVSNQTHRLHVLLEAVECKLIILDEFQHLCDKGQKLRMRTSADWLKNLLQTNRYGLIAVGLPEAASVIQNHPQLRARFDNELSMPRFDWSSTNSAAQFCGILQQFEKQLAPFELPPLKSPEMALVYVLGQRRSESDCWPSSSIAPYGMPSERIVWQSAWRTWPRRMNAPFGAQTDSRFPMVPSQPLLQVLKSQG